MPQHVRSLRGARRLTVKDGVERPGPDVEEVAVVIVILIRGIPHSRKAVWDKEKHVRAKIFVLFNLIEQRGRASLCFDSASIVPDDVHWTDQENRNDASKHRAGKELPVSKQYLSPPSAPCL